MPGPCRNEVNDAAHAAPSTTHLRHRFNRSNCWYFQGQSLPGQVIGRGSRVADLHVAVRAVSFPVLLQKIRCSRVKQDSAKRRIARTYLPQTPLDNPNTANFPSKFPDIRELVRQT